MTMTHASASITPGTVHEIIGRHMQADGLPLVLDLERSQGRRLIDARNGQSYLDMFSFFGTLPIGINHPKMSQPDFTNKLGRVARTNPTNSDVYTVEMAEFVATWARLAMPDYLPHLFLVAGGALAVENALKVAFDWKVRQNLRKGHMSEIGQQVIHFRGAFHGRSGYTLSLTNTADPRKYQYYPHFEWPRINAVPALRFPVDQAEVERVTSLEYKAIRQIKHAFRERHTDIACIIIEPIQGEGGDNHFRPEFLRALRQLADENNVLLIFDEIQTGMGLTGKMWAHQHDDVRPDILVFGKKSQVCGIMAGPKIDEEPENVFRVGSRLNSTWGGNLADMVRCQRYLEIMDEENLIAHAATIGRNLLAELEIAQGEYPRVLSNARGRGLMCAVDVIDTAMRDGVINIAYQRGMIVLPCGERSIRFRPPLDVTAAEIGEATDILIRSIARYINS